MLKARAVVGHLPDLNYLGVVGFRLPCGYSKRKWPVFGRFLKPVTSVLFLLSLVGSSLRRSALSADAYIVSLEFANPYLVSPELHCSWCVIVIYAVGIAVYFIISVVIAVFDRRCCRFLILAVFLLSSFTLLSSLTLLPLSSMFCCLYCLCLCYLRSALIRRVIH